MRKKILMLVPDVFMIDRRVLQQANSLQQEGYKVTLLAGFECAEYENYTWNDVEIYRFPFDWNDTRFDIILDRIPSNFPRVRQLVHKILSYLQFRVKKFSYPDHYIYSKCLQFPADIVHVHDLPLLRVAHRLAQTWNAKLVYDAHEIYHEQQSLPIVNRKIYAETEQRLIKDVDLFFTVNKGIADYFYKRYGRCPDVLYNATIVDEPINRSEAREKLRSIANLPDDSKIILFQGWFSSERNLLELVKAAELFNDNIYLVLIGYGQYEPVLRKALQDNRGNDRVKFLGKIPADELLNYTVGADLGIIPYLPIDINHELCSPNKFFEYVQSGVPVLAHELLFFQQMQDQYQVVKTYDLSTASQIAFAINKLIESPDLMDMQNACKEAAKHLNWHKESEKLLECYNQMLDKDGTEMNVT